MTRNIEREVSHLRHISSAVFYVRLRRTTKRRRRRRRRRWRWGRMTSMTICRQKTVPGVLRLLRIVVNSPGSAIQNNNTNTYNNTQSKYRIYILVTLSSIQGFGVSGCISCIVMYHYATQVHQFYCVLALSIVSLWGRFTDCIVLLCLYCKHCMIQSVSLWSKFTDCIAHIKIATSIPHLSVWNWSAPFVSYFNVFCNRYQIFKITLVSLTYLSSSFS